MEYYFKTEQLSVGYQSEPLIRDIEIGLNKGEILTLIGPNGAGKSTILKSIARQLKLIDGVVYLDKKDLAQMSGTEISQKISGVFTEKLKTELMSCEDVVATGRYPYTGHFGILSKVDYAVVEEAMELVHVTEIRNLDFTKISDGQRQRVMLARAICQEPEIIILDEPTSFLDVKYKLEFLSVLQELRIKKGLTVIMSIHELELAERVSDKILCVNGEYVERLGKPEEIFKSGYIKSLFGIETGTFDEENSSMELEAATGEPEVFVIAGDGTGRSVYRMLQRKGTSFITGILYKNDLDYPVAKALATDVIETESFEPIKELLLKEAKEKLDGCKRVICCKNVFGTFEKANEELLTYAKEKGKDVEMTRQIMTSNDRKGMV
ncbi:MAG: ABC transporter ATP-binding protein [Lachnospiraceae bacterium]|nr:ABC transporter ATP-binding protein [Lachnospiraceae bacterium]